MITDSIPSKLHAVATAPTSTEIPDELQQLREEWLMQHHRLGHPSQKRQAALEIEGTAKPKVPKLACPTCLASKARKSNRPPANSKEERSTIPWEDIHSDLSGKISTRSARGYKYFVVFICTATGAKHVEFLAHKNHFINAYRRLVIELGAHPKTIRTDQGTEYLNKEMTELLESNYVRHVVAAVNEHYNNGPAEHAVHTQLLDGRKASRHPQRDTRHGRKMDL
jgi:transposase InsO family protein